MEKNTAHKLWLDFQPEFWLESQKKSTVIYFCQKKTFLSLRRHYVHIILSFKQCVLDFNIWYNMKILFTILVLISIAISKTFWPWCAITIEKPFYSFTKQAVCQIIFWIPIIIKVKCVYEWMNEVKCVTISRPSHLQTTSEFSKMN